MQLARPGDPLIDRDGTLVEAEGRREPDYALTIPIAKNLRSKTPRSVRELGSDPQTQTIINAVLIYKLLGVSTNEIAHTLGTNAVEIERIFALSGFQDTFEKLFRELLSTNSNSLQARLAAFAGRAVENVMTLADAKPVIIVGKDDAGNEYQEEKHFVPPIVVLKANESILDRAGLSAETLFGGDNQSEAPQLEIEITSSSENKTDLKVNIKR